MEIEQRPPNQPKFLLIVLLFAASLIVIFIIAYFLLDWDAGGLLPKHHPRHPTSQLVLPGPSSSTLA
jgi:hypothetical protein